MYIHKLQADQKAVLDAFVANHPRGGIEQTWEWGVLQTRIPGRPAFHVFGVFEDGLGSGSLKLVGSMLVIRQNAGLGKTWLWCPRGPLLPGKGADEAWEMLREECKKLTAEAGDVFLRVESGYLKEDELVVRGKIAPGAYLPEDTLILDLTLSEEELLKQMSQKGRYHIKTAEKSGVKVECVGGDSAKSKEFDEFYRLLCETAKRDGFFVHKKSFYKAFLEELGERAVFYVAKVGGQVDGGRADELVVGGALMVHFGDTATYYFGASSGEHREVKAANALQWFAIREAKRAGFKRYDFLGIAPEGAVLDGKASTGKGRHVLAGVTQFKMSFGGRRVSYQKAQVFVYRKFWCLVYRLAKWLRK